MRLRREPSPMPTLHVQVICFVDEHFPGFVECEFVDASGQPHRFIEKAPVVTVAPLSSETPYPQPGIVACVIESESQDDAGRALLNISTDPWGITSLEGVSRFVVFAPQIQLDA